MSAAVLAALRSIDDRLHRDPLVFGEQKYHYRGLKLELRVGIEPPLIVRYAVHEQKPLVIIKDVLALPGQGI
jgi:hypothetical protein